MNEYTEYRSSLCSLKSLLGLGCFHLCQRDEILPYITRILSTVNEWLIMEDKTTVPENVKLFIGYYEDGMEKMISPGRVDELLSDYGYTRGEDGFVQRYFAMAWTNVYTTIYLELLYNYSYLFTTEATDCHDCCGSISEDSDGNLVYNQGSGNLSSPWIGCGCGN